MDTMKEFKIVDTNADKRIDMDEALAFDQGNERKIVNEALFKDMDVNGDGFISPHEFDSDLSAADDTVDSDLSDADDTVDINNSTRQEMVEKLIGLYISGLFEA